MFGHTDLVKYVLKQEGINVNSKFNGYYNQPSLFEVSSKGFIDIVKLLLACNEIDTNNKEESCGYSPLLGAVANGQTEIVKLLLEQKGIDINIRDKCGWTPLMTSSVYGDIEIVKLLL